MIYLELSGGLGNQLFEYAMARRVLEERRKEKPNEKMTLLLSRYSKDVRKYSLDSFMIDKNIQIVPMWKQSMIAMYYKIKKHLLMRTKIKDTHLISGKKSFTVMCREGMLCTTDTYDYYPYTIPKKNNIYIYGNFQSEKYFQDIKEIILDEFQIKKSAIAIESTILEDIKNKNSVAVHIRRGDYLSTEWGKKLDVCTQDYYINAMNYIIQNVKNPVFYVFSNTRDDLMWIKNNMKLPGTVQYVDQDGSEIDDFYLMSRCKHHIISNSTYSWWSSYIAREPDKIVVAPLFWYKTEDQNPKDVYLDTWTLIDINKR